MTDPVSVSALLIGAGVAVITQILTLIDTAIRRKTNSSCKEALSALKGTITRIQPILKKRRDKDSAVYDWFEKLATYLNTASYLVEQTKLLSRIDSQIKKLITNLTEDIEEHLRLSSLVNIVQNEEILDTQQKILEEQRQIMEALGFSSPVEYTAKAAHNQRGIMNSKEEHKPVTGNLSTVSSFQDQHVDFHLSWDGFLTSGRIGMVLHDYDDELNLTAGEEVQIISEENGWFCVLKKHPGRNGKSIGLVPMLCVNSS